ncbi:MAG: 50S ribosomal protein L25 [bacterium]|nr:50S ribosomal protein L25 [bacterium]
MVKKTHTQNKIELNATTREVTGKKVKQLRKQGIIPANIFGPDFQSRSISVDQKDFSNAYKAAKETGIVYVTHDGTVIPTLIRNVQRHPISDMILHIDFRRIDLTKKIETTVPVKVKGASEAVNQKGGILLTQSDHLLIEALPTDIPSSIEIDITILKEIGQEIRVKDLAVTTNYSVKEDPEKVILSVVAHKEESVTPETTTATPEVITEVKTEEGAPAEAGSPTAPAAAPTPEKKEPLAKKEDKKK